MELSQQLIRHLETAPPPFYELKQPADKLLIHEANKNSWGKLENISY